MNCYYVYMMANKRHNVLYIGVTNDLERRVIEHKSGTIEGFTSKYNAYDLVYYEEYGDINDALHREKQLKRWSRAKKDALVETINPQWKDLAEE